MKDLHWNTLLGLIQGKLYEKPQVGLIIDSPWIPGWYGCSIIDLYTDNATWLAAHLKAAETFPDVMFLPGFWSEFGMCTEPSAFGSKLKWEKDNLPYAEKTIFDISDIEKIEQPNVETDGLLPFMLNRLVVNRQAIEDKGYKIRFAIARGPLNIASFLMGTTEFMMALHIYPEEIKILLDKITQFTIDWLKLQIKTIDSIDGILLLDDIVGFVGEEDFKTYALPYLKKIYQAFDVSVKFFHNDAQGLVCAPYLPEIGINLFNFSFEHSLQEMKDLTNNSVVLLGNLPPRDVLANGTIVEIERATKEMYHSVADKSRILWSVGGGMPQGVTTENVNAFLNALK